ncbi:protocadherin Fat 4-like [Mytilus edulis]|uniref:protocadherin Fat 4-like n=1 Tax=Mytilus edulis TaxID=6550 RepID=UPI0039EE3DBE
MSFMSHLMFGVYLILLCFPAYTSAVACGVKTIGGANLGGGSYTNWDNTTTGAGYLAKEYFLDCCGLLSGFNVEIAGLGTLHLQIWRQSGSTYTLVHSSQYTFSTADALTVHYLPIDATDQPTILENDMLGWYTSGTDMVPYDNGAGAVNQNYRVDAGSASGSTPFNSGSLLGGRSYAINFVTAVNSAPYFTNGGTKVSFLDTKTVSTGITLYQMSFTDDNKDDTTLTVEMTNKADTTFISDLRHRIKSNAADWKVGEYTLEYSVKDQCLNEGTTSVIVCVNNTAPEIKNTVISYNIKENNNDETQIMSLTVTDKQTYRCNLGTVSPNDGIFIIKQPTGTDPFNLYLKGGSMKDMDYDAKPQYTVTAVCTDDLGLATEKIFYVNVEKNIEPVINVLPTTVQKSALTTKSGDQIYQVDIIDTDTAAEDLTFSITCSPTQCPFTISPTGEITATEDLTLHKVSPYKIYVVVKDEQRTTGPKTLTVELTDINDRPEINNLGVTSLTQPIDENIDGDTTIGRQVYDIDITDDNIGDTHTFSATTNPNGCSDLYSLDPTTGVVSTTAILNYEELKTSSPQRHICDLIVTVDDGRETSIQKKLRIEVTDVNEQQTGFEKDLYTITGTEGTKGTVLPAAGFVVNDVDINDVQTYTMDCKDKQSYFDMDPTTGRITQLQEYDLDPNNWQFNTPKCDVTATDKAGHTVTTKLNIRIEEINDNPPKLNQRTYYKNVPQNTPVGSQLLSCTSTDDDVKTEHTQRSYSLGDSNFAVDNSCNIRSATDFSGYPVGTTFTFPLTATDSDDTSLNDEATVTIVIIDPTTTTVTTTVANTITNANNNNGNTGTGTGTGTGTSNTGNSGSPAAFLSRPTDLAWFIPAMIALAVMTALLGYMIYRCCRVPGFCARLFSDTCGCFNDRDCCGKRGRGKITNPKAAKKNNAVSDKSEPRSKEKPQKPRKIRDPESNDGNSEWNIWSHSDFSAKTDCR